MVVVGDVEEEEDVDKLLLPVTPSIILSVPIIKRLNANINVRTNTPNKEFVKTRSDTTIDNIPTPISNALDHFEDCLSKIP